MVSKLRSQQWLPQLSHAKPENKFYPVRNYHFDGKSGRKSLAVRVSAMRTTAEVREKWKSLHSQAKKEFIELAKIKFVLDCGTFVVCRRPLNNAGLFRNQGTRHIGNYSGNGGLIHTGESVADNLKETSTNVKPEGN